MSATAANPTADKYGDPAFFVEEAELLRYRAITTLLAATNAIDEDVEERAPQYHATQAKDKKQAQIYQHLADLTELLPRDYEVVAATIAADFKSIIITGSGEEENEERCEEADHEQEEMLEDTEQIPSKNLLSARNPVTNDFVMRKGRSESKGCQPLRAEIQTQTAISIGHSPGKHFLLRTVGTKTGVGVNLDKPRTDLSLGEHGSILLTLLKETYASKEIGYTSEHQRLHRYVIINSLAKIHGRMQRGSHSKRGFLDHLKKGVEHLPGEMEMRMAKGTLNESHTLSEHELRSLQEVVDMLKENRSFEPGPLRAWDDTFTSQTNIVCDTAFCTGFQYLLSTVFKELIESIENLYDRKERLQLDRLANKPDDATLATWGTELDRAADKAFRAMWMVSVIKGQSQLRFLLRLHLHWLLGLQGIPTTNIGDPGTEIPKDRRHSIKHMSSDFTTLSGDARPHDEPPTSDDPLSSDPGHVSDHDQINPFNAEEYDDLSNDKEDDRHGHIYASDYHGIDASVARNDRPDAIIKYLDLTCLHLTAMLNLAAGEDKSPELRDFIQDANLDWLRHYHDDSDRNMMTLGDLLNVIKKDNGEKLTKKELNNIVKPWLEDHNDFLKPQSTKKKDVDSRIREILTKQHGDLDHAEKSIKRKYYADPNQKPKPGKYERENAFSGNSHAESHLFNDQLHKRAGDKFISADDSVKVKHLLLPPKEVTDKMGEILQILPVSKRCCPACFELLRFVQDEQGKKIMHPGNHTIWTATALPANIPRDAGLRVLNFAETTLRKRLSKIIDQVKINSIGDLSSTGTAPGNDAIGTPRKGFGFGYPGKMFRRSSRGESDRDDTASTGSAPAATSAPSLVTSPTELPLLPTAGAPGSPTKKHGRDFSIHDKVSKPRLGAKGAEERDVDTEAGIISTGGGDVEGMEGLSKASGGDQKEDR